LSFLSWAIDTTGTDTNAKAKTHTHRFMTASNARIGTPHGPGTVAFAATEIARC
jgi:hypothetical protein